MEFNEAVAVVSSYHKLAYVEIKHKKPEAKFKEGDYVRLSNKNKKWSDTVQDLDGCICKIVEVYKPAYEIHFKYNVESGDGTWFPESDCTLVPTDEAIAAIAESLKNRPSLIQAIIKRIGTQDTGVATFGIRYSSGRDYIQVADICHARMKWGYDDEMKEMLEIRNWVAGYRPKDAPNQAIVYDKYLHYMLNDSPWSSACLTKDIKEAYRDGVLMDVNKNVSVIVGACIAIREGWEHNSRMRLFGDLMNKGVNGHVAYLVSAYVGYRIGGKEYAITGISQGHMVLHQSLAWEGVKRFFREGYDPKLKGIAKDKSQTHYEIFNTIVRCKGDQYRGSHVQANHLKEVFDNVIAVETQGEGFSKRTVVNQACVDRLVEFLTKELT